MGNQWKSCQLLLLDANFHLYNTCGSERRAPSWKAPPKLFRRVDLVRCPNLTLGLKNRRMRKEGVVCAVFVGDICDCN